MFAAGSLRPADGGLGKLQRCAMSGSPVTEQLATVVDATDGSITPVFGGVTYFRGGIDPTD